MEYTENKDLAISRLDRIEQDISDEQEDQQNLFTNVLIGGTILSGLLIAEVDLISEPYRRALEHSYDIAGRWGTLLVAQTPLAIIFGFSVRNEVRKYWQDKSIDFIRNEDSNIRFDEKYNDGNYPLYDREDIEQIVKKEAADKYGGENFLSLKAMFKDRHDFPGHRSYVFNLGVLASFMAAVTFINFTGTYDFEGEKSQSHRGTYSAQP